MKPESADIIDQAIAWHLRAPGMRDEEWRSLADWLASSRDHARRYNQVAESLALADRCGYPLRQTDAMISSGAEQVWGMRRRWLAGAGAALAAGLAFLVVQLPQTSVAADRLIVTNAGAPRNVTLADGSLIALNGASRLRINGRNPRLVALDAGEATFHVRHDRNAPFILRSGKMTVEDVGTVFNVIRSGNRVDVAVAEGAVSFRHGDQAMQLRAGEGLSAHDSAPQIALVNVPIQSVSSWRKGRLSFSSAPILQLVEAIHRRYGTDIAVSSQLAGLPFSGTVTLEGDSQRDIPHVAALIGASYRQDGVRWTLLPPSQKTN